MAQKSYLKSWDYVRSFRERETITPRQLKNWKWYKRKGEMGGIREEEGRREHRRW